MTPLAQKYGKTPRLYRDVIITEKLDGTNASVIIRPLAFVNEEYGSRGEQAPEPLADFNPDHDRLGVYAASRNRLLTLENDNYGFAAWVQENAQRLTNVLGEGRFSGEWVGHGIQKNPYGMSHKAFALFRTDLMQIVDESRIDQLDTVPVLYDGPYTDTCVSDSLSALKTHGSLYAEDSTYVGEGVCMYHKDSGQVFKITHDDSHKETR